MIVAEVIRVLGPTVLQGFLGGGTRGRGKTKSNDNNNNDDIDDGSTVTVAVPVDDDDSDSDDDDDEVNNIVKDNNNESNSKDISEKVSLPLPTASSTDNENKDNSTRSTTISIELSTLDGSPSEGRMFGYFPSYHDTKKKKTNKLAYGMLALYFILLIKKKNFLEWLLFLFPIIYVVFDHGGMFHFLHKHMFIYFFFFSSSLQRLFL